MSKLWNIAVVGATGEVGAQMIECLEERKFPVNNVRFLAVGGSVGEPLELNGKPVLVEELTQDSFSGVDIAFFAAGDELAKGFCPAAAASGAVCIDTSAAWRLDPDVPLVVPEVNPDAIAGYAGKGIIANPGCSTIQMALVLKPLHDQAAIKRVVVSTYQGVSGSGREAVDELRKQVIELLNGRPVVCKVYPHQIAFNCLPQIDSFCDGGDTMAEVNMVNETRKIMATEIRVSATAVRVPVFYGDSASLNIETGSKLTLAKARGVLKKAPGVKLVDDPGKNVYPTPLNASGQDLVLVGRIREDLSVENGLNLWVSADNIRKGAATNAVQIAEILVAKYLK